jgi:hypothetical protein
MSGKSAASSILLLVSTQIMIISDGATDIAEVDPPSELNREKQSSGSISRSRAKD